MSERRKLLWDSMLDAEMYANYWLLEQERQSKISRVFQVVIAVASSSAFASLFVLQHEPAVQRAVTGLAGVLSIFAATWLPPDLLKKTSSAGASWNDVATRYKILWADDSELADPKNWDEFQKLATRNDPVPSVSEKNRILAEAQKKVLQTRQLSFQE